MWGHHQSQSLDHLLWATVETWQSNMDGFMEEPLHPIMTGLFQAIENITVHCYPNQNTLIHLSRHTGTFSTG